MLANSTRVHVFRAARLEEEIRDQTEAAQWANAIAAGLTLLDIKSSFARWRVAREASEDAAAIRARGETESQQLLKALQRSTIEPGDIVMGNVYAYLPRDEVCSNTEDLCTQPKRPISAPPSCRASICTRRPASRSAGNPASVPRPCRPPSGQSASRSRIFFPLGSRDQQQLDLVVQALGPCHDTRRLRQSANRPGKVTDLAPARLGSPASTSPPQARCRTPPTRRHRAGRRTTEMALTRRISGAPLSKSPTITKVALFGR